jgi:hypothetical protein
MANDVAALDERFAVAGGDAITLGGQVVAPNSTTLTIRFDPQLPQEPLLNLLANSSGGGTRIVRALPPVDIQVLADRPITGGQVTILFPYHYLGVDFATLGDRRLTVLQGLYEEGRLVGLEPTAGRPQPGGWEIDVPAETLGFTPFLPVVLTPAWVQNHDPLVHVWSGPTREARDFGFAGPQFTTFTVVAPQVVDRLFVYSPVVDNFAWIDVFGVGPSGPPA